MLLSPHDELRLRRAVHRLRHADRGLPAIFMRGDAQEASQERNDAKRRQTSGGDERRYARDSAMKSRRQL